MISYEVCKTYVKINLVRNEITLNMDEILMSKDSLFRHYSSSDLNIPINLDCKEI